MAKEHSRRTRILLIILILLALLMLCGLLYVLRAVTQSPDRREVISEVPGVELEFQAYGGSWGATLERPVDVAYDGENRIYVTVPGASRIVYFDRNGKDGQIFVEDAYEPNHQRTDFDVLVPCGIDVADDGLIYVADTQKAAIVVFSPEGQKLREFDLMGAKHVEVQAGRVYALSDTGKLVVLDTEGNRLGEWGTEGRGPDQLKDPNGVAVDADGNIYISDMDNYRVISLDPELEVRWRYGSPSFTNEEHTARSLASPTGITIGQDGYIYLTDSLSSVVQVLDSAGKIVSAPLGQMGNADDQFYFPSSIECIDENLFVMADTYHDRIVGVRLTHQEVAEDTQASSAATAAP
ncbi:MAG: hypothetical protein CVT60_07125 [Actinobacteria bacterium HGW-Actinobacteria-10]|nr:MAG: hypothetical protein CVT60_07125 [Actinobacteria bacterium HGW-Actinobacteria-10]